MDRGTDGGGHRGGQRVDGGTDEGGQSDGWGWGKRGIEKEGLERHRRTDRARDRVLL